MLLQNCRKIGEGWGSGSTIFVSSISNISLLTTFNSRVTKCDQPATNCVVMAKTLLLLCMWGEGPVHLSVKSAVLSMFLKVPELCSIEEEIDASLQDEKKASQNLYSNNLERATI